MAAKPNYFARVVAVVALIGAVVLGLSAYRADADSGRGGRLAAAAITLVGIAFHAGSLLVAQRASPGAALSLGDTASIVGLVIAGVCVYMTLRSGPAGAVALLLVIAAALEGGLSRGNRHFSVAQPGWELTFHVAVATAAFAMLTVGAAFAAAQAVVDRRLRSHRPLGVLRLFSPLESLESGCFQAILAGFLLLTLALVSGAFFIENLFALPGLGQASQTAVSSHDFPALIGVVVIATIVVVLTNLVLDILVAALDPKVRTQ